VRYLKAFALGAVAAAVLATAALLALSAVASTAGTVDIDVGVGPVRVARVLRERGTTETSMGPGLLVLAAAAGLANAAVLELTRKRAAGESPAGGRSRSPDAGPGS
jgi:hypothetical protein